MDTFQLEERLCLSARFMLPSLPLMIRFSSPPPNALRMTNSPCFCPRNLRTISAVSMSINWTSLSAMLTSMYCESWLILIHVILTLSKILYSSSRVMKLYTMICFSGDIATKRRPSGDMAQSCTRCSLDQVYSALPFKSQRQSCDCLSSDPVTKVFPSGAHEAVETT